MRTWTVTRFRGRISTQPGSTPIASFKLLSLEGAHSLFYPVNSIGEELPQHELLVGKATVSNYLESLSYNNYLRTMLTLFSEDKAQVVLVGKRM